MATKTLQVAVSGTAVPFCGSKYSTGNIAIDAVTGLATGAGGADFITGAIRKGMVAKTNADRIYRIIEVLSATVVRVAGTVFNPVLITEAAAAYSIYSMPRSSEVRITCSVDTYVGKGSGVLTTTGYKLIANQAYSFYGKDLMEADWWLVAGAGGTAIILLEGADLNEF